MNPSVLELRIDEARTHLGAVALEVGWKTLSRDIETAIAEVEDEIARVAAAVPGHMELQTGDPTIAQMAVAGGDRVYREAVEQLLQRTAARPAGTRRFLGTLVILRELMHHFDLPAIRVSSGP